MSRILVLFGTTDGHTATVARHLGDTLAECGAKVDVIEARHGRSIPSPARYDGVIVAASVHVGGYQRGVLRWLRANRTALAERPSAFVTVCLAVLQSDPGVQRQLARIRDRFLRRAGWTPMLQETVAGALPFTRYGWLKRAIMLRIARQQGLEADPARDYSFTDWSRLREFGQRCFELMATVPSTRV